MQVEDRAFKQQRLNIQREFARWCPGIKRSQAQCWSQLIELCRAALPVEELWSGAVERKLQRLLRVIFMCHNACDPRGAGKDAHGQLFEEGLPFALAGVAEHAADLLRPRRAQLDLNVRHQIHFVECQVSLGDAFFCRRTGRQGYRLWLFLILWQQADEARISHIERWRNFTKRRSEERRVG